MSPYPPFISDVFCGLSVALSSELYNFKLSVVQDIKTPADILLQITQTLRQVQSVLLSCKRVLLTNISVNCNSSSNFYHVIYLYVVTFLNCVLVELNWPAFSTSNKANKMTGAKCTVVIQTWNLFIQLTSLEVICPQAIDALQFYYETPRE